MRCRRCRRRRRCGHYNRGRRCRPFEFRGCIARRDDVDELRLLRPRIGKLLALLFVESPRVNFARLRPHLAEVRADLEWERLELVFVEPPEVILRECVLILRKYVRTSSGSARKCYLFSETIRIRILNIICDSSLTTNM